MSMSFMSFFIISYYFFLNLVTHDNCISELSAFALQYFSVALYLLCPTFHSWHENHKLNWELWSENWRERERDLKGSWAVKWRRWWQGEGNFLEDKQKRETQMKMRVERYRKRREEKTKRNEDCSKRTVGSRPQSYNRLWNTVHISCVLFQRHSVRCWAEAVKGEPGPWHFACVDSCLWDNSLLFFCFVILYRSLKEKHSFCLGALRWEARVSARPAAAC